MTTASQTLRPVLLAGLVAAAISAAGIGFVLTRGGPSADPDAGLSQGQRADVERTVRNYLIDHPELLIEMSGLLEKRQSEAQAKAMESALAENADALYRSQSAPTIGNPDGDVTLVEFFDYNCGYCKRAFPDVAKLVESDSNVRVVFMELPILRRESEGATRVALAAAKQDRYFDLHRALLEADGIASEDSALKIAADLGLDVERLKTDMKGADVDNAVADARELAERIGVQGTPFYLIGDRTVPGAPEDLFDQLTARVAEVREKGCAAQIAC